MSIISSVVHAFTSLKSEGSDPSVVSANEWNAAHAGNGLGWINVKDNGAKCDGTTNDAAAIQACLNALSGGGQFSGGGRVYMPPGSINLGTTGLTIPGPNISLIGAGKIATELIYTGSGSVITNANPGTTYAGVVMRDFGINLSGASAGAIGVNMQTFTYAIVEHLSINAYGVAATCLQLLNNGNYYNRFADIICNTNGIGIYLTGTGGCNRNLFENINVQPGGGGASQMLKMDATTYNQDTNTFVLCSGEGMTGNPCIDIGGANTYGGSHNLFIGLTLESCTYGPIFRANSQCNLLIGGFWASTPDPVFTGTLNSWILAAYNTPAGYYGLVNAGGKADLSCAGGQFVIPSGTATPTDAVMDVPTNGGIFVDTANNKLWIRTGAATWKGVAIA